MSTPELPFAEDELAGARFAAQSHLKTVNTQAAIIANMPDAMKIDRLRTAYAVSPTADNWKALADAYQMPSQPILSAGEPQVWVPVSEKMPHNYREVYAKHTDGSFRIARRSMKGGGIWQLACFGAGETSVWADSEVTHWCILSNLAATSAPILSAEVARAAGGDA